METKEGSRANSVSEVPTPRNGSQAGIDKGDEGEAVVAVNTSDTGSDSKLDAESELFHSEGGLDTSFLGDSGEDDRAAG